MSQAYDSVRIKRYRTTPRGHRCDCGRVAFAYKRGGWVCARCDALEAAMREPPKETVSLVTYRLCEPVEGCVAH